jgi:hypothetical protein
MSPESKKYLSPTEVTDGDGSKFEYFSLGKKKSMEIDRFQRINVFSDEKYRRLLNTMFDFVGPVKELASRALGLKDRKGKLRPPRPDDLAEVRAMVSDLLSLGLAKYVISSSEFGKGGYYSLTDDGVEYYTGYLADKLPDLYKRFLKEVGSRSGRGGRLSTREAAMLVSDFGKADPLLTAVAVAGGGPVPIQKAVGIYLDYETKVGGRDEAAVSGEDYREGVVRRLRSLVSKGLLRAGNSERGRAVALTPGGKKITSAVFRDLSQIISESASFGVLETEGGKGGLPGAVGLTNLGEAVRKAHLDRISQELIPAPGGYESGEPPVPIEQVDPEPRPVYKLKMTTGRPYGLFRMAAIKMWRGVKGLNASTVFWAFISVCILSMLLGVAFGSLEVVVGSLLAAAGGFVALIVYYALREMRFTLRR